MDLFQFVDYRVYLRQFYEDRKAQNPLYSYQMMGMRLEMDASYVAKVLAGQRHLPTKKIAAAVKLCSLAGRHAEYFEVLVLFCRARTEKETRTYFEKMIRLRATESQILSASQAKFYSNWYFTAIRAVLGFRDWIDEYEEIGNQLDPRLSATEVREAIEFLVENQLVVRSESGVLATTTRHIRSGATGHRETVRAFQKQMLDLAKRSIDTHPPKLRDVSTLTMAIRRDSLADIHKILEDCRQAIRQRIDLDKDPDCIYQLNFQAFPLTRIEP
jgi:uncharacterized protein (TIGR02147 family)